MSKELTPLEALKRLYDFNDLPGRNMIAYLLEQENLPTYYKVIEKALKRLEDYESHTTFTMVNQINGLADENKELRKRLNTMYELRNNFNLDQNKLKALEIIKEKKVDTQLLDRGYVTCSFDYNNEFDDKKYHLTQEEYELLKEVLL